MKYRKSKKMLARAILSILVIPFLLSVPQTTSAQWPGIEVGPNLWVNTASSISNIARTSKDYVLDGVAWVVAKQIVAKLTAQTVNWINGGFKGNPAFVTNPDQFFLQIGDQTAADFLTKLSNSGTNLCSPFKAQVRLALVKNYLNETSNENFSCTLGKLENNYDTFINNFNQGGWDAWINITQNDQNNPYGEFLEAKKSMSAQVGNEQIKIKTELSQGKGFLSFKTCQHISAQTKKDYPDLSDCVPGTEETQTPGGVIEAQLEHILPSGVDELKIADSINEVIGSLVSQLVSQVVGGAGKGLRSLTQSGSGTKNNSQSYFQELNTEASSIGSDVAHNLETGVAPELRASVPAREGQPFIILKGRNPEKMYVGVKYTDPGASAFDPVDGEISDAGSKWTGIHTTGSVNVNAEGTYSIAFDASNSKGVAANTVTRQVIVEKEPETPTCVPPQIGIWPACTGPGGNVGTGNTGVGNTGIGGGNVGAPGGGTGNPPPSNVVPVISSAQGYTQAGGMSSNIYAGGTLVLRGTFAPSGNKVTVSGVLYMPSNEDGGQISFFLNNDKTGVLSVTVSNGTVSSAPINIVVQRQ